MKKIIAVICMIMVTVLGADTRIFLNPPDFIKSAEDIKKAGVYFDNAAAQCYRLSIRASAKDSSHTEIRSAVYQMEEITDTISDVIFKIRQFADNSDMTQEIKDEISGICSGIEHTVFMAESDCYVIESLCFQDETLPEARAMLRELTGKWDDTADYAQQLADIF